MAAKQPRSTTKRKPRHRGRKPRYTQVDWERLVKTGMAWELFPGGPETFVGRVVIGGKFKSKGGTRPLDEPKKDNHAVRHETKKAHAALLKKQEEEKAAREAEAAELAALEEATS